MRKVELRRSHLIDSGSWKNMGDKIVGTKPGVARGLIETHVVGWLESCVPESCSERQLEELDRLIEPWLDDYERTSRARRK
ncbi:MAG TPA: hypothetical protein VGS02_18155 [Acidobacteriaceae bacterium]|nr:hypothetical protein [Acidobacteriaceae bacterium]